MRGCQRNNLHLSERLAMCCLMKVKYRVLLYPGIYFEGLPMSRRIVLDVFQTYFHARMAVSQYSMLNPVKYHTWVSRSLVIARFQKFQDSSGTKSRLVSTYCQCSAKFSPFIEYLAVEFYRCARSVFRVKLQL